jgi:hypothetical protein
MSMRLDWVQVDDGEFEVLVGDEIVAMGTMRECSRALRKRYGADAICEATGTIRMLSMPVTMPAHVFTFDNMRAHRDHMRGAA